ncbi:anthrone oxygenase family protein [Labrys wisconsinensis]|uniref:Membrane protein n=1 Tax=Labrys wisconsinensis TaxID=425677 RepID=A0ABU0JFU2_9HYPH|nr:anthrone oxygenase family protein [Labrys wisconsinensis]MDQ0473156.1 putative membrane protein [Labrys wisconsinensis]
MTERALLVLTVAAAIGSGLVAGIFFAFSSFVMAALGRLPPEQGVAAMQSINITVINPVFMLAFMGTGLVCLVLAAGSVLWWSQGGGWPVIAAGLLYLVGCIGVTMACNVPLNDALAVVQPGTPDAASLWQRYLVDWTFWNHVRMAASLLAAVLCILAVP